jgi:hypothetical protein
MAPTSHAPVTPSPTRAPAVAPRFTAFGQGQCQDSGDRLYDLVFLNGQTQDINAAYNWCLTATAVKSKLVGVEISTNGDKICRYDDGAIDNIKTTDFNPAALSTSNPPGAGQGAVVSSDGTSDITCYKILVCRESIPTALFHFLPSLTTFPNSLILIVSGLWFDLPPYQEASLQLQSHLIKICQSQEY